MAEAILILDLRSYSGETQVHHHDYHQLVLPVSGKLSMQIDGHFGHSPRQFRHFDQDRNLCGL